jgi:hypothetical protein
VVVEAAAVPPAVAVAVAAAVAVDQLRADIGELMKLASRYLPGLIFLGALLFALVSFAVLAFAGAQPQQRTFATPEAGVAALIDAVRQRDRSALESILGPGSRQVIESGDPVADAEAREDFLAAYDAKSNLVAVNASTRTLQVGDDDWPLPIPLVRRGNTWRFDLAAGREELINRRIGRNETNAIEASEAFIDAQQEYASEDRDGDMILEYAQRFVSTPGLRDGLYWPTLEGDPESPLGPLFAEARTDGYRLETAGSGSGYYGYRYRILTSQGPAAMGGAFDYIIGGKMIGGVGMIAYPVQYGVSGVMSFIVNHDGVVYQKDLGPETAEAAAAITSFNPDSTWQRVATQIPVATGP